MVVAVAEADKVISAADKVVIVSAHTQEHSRFKLRLVQTCGGFVVETAEKLLSGEVVNVIFSVVENLLDAVNTCLEEKL